MLSRRALLVGMGACGLSSSAVGITLGCQTNAWPTYPRRFESVLSVLKKIRELGFAGFETGFRNLQSQTKHLDAARGQIESTGLEFFGVHIFLSQYDPQTRIAPTKLYEKVAESAAKLGARWLILSGAPASAGTGLADKTAALDRAGAFAKK